MLRKAGNAPGHKPVVVNFACVLLCICICIYVCICCCCFVGWLVGWFVAWLVVFVGCFCWLLLVVVGCLLVVCCLCVVYLLFVVCCLLFVVVVVVVAAAIISFVGILVGRAARAHACHRAPQKCFLSGVMVLFFLLVGCISLWLHARDGIHS